MVSIGQNTAAAEKLTALLERMERLLDEIDGLKDDLKDLKGQAKDEGFNVAALVRLVAIRRNNVGWTRRMSSSMISCCTHMRPERRSTSPLATARKHSTPLRRKQKRSIARMTASLLKAFGQPNWRRSTACISGPIRTGKGRCVRSWACVPAVVGGPSKSDR
jgi:uncharacterized protein (UPF0335 family)